MKRPRLGFLGVGWIGFHRLEAIFRSGEAVIAAAADPNDTALERVRELVPGVRTSHGLDSLLAEDLDGVVIATPSAGHAAQSIAALESGRAVFCQKPLGRSSGEARAVVDAARGADRLLGVDLSYRFLSGAKCIRSLVRDGAIGSVYAANMVFHNAYGPDKAWYFNPSESGGGCVFDLGIHLVDLALWTLGFPKITGCESRLYAKGTPLVAPGEAVEDFAVARLDLDTGAALNIACSWNLHAGRDAVFEASFYGAGGGLAMRNVNGSFYDFRAERYRGTAREVLSEPPEEWGGRAAADWARRLAAAPRFDPEAESIVTVTGALDSIYGRPGGGGE